MREIIGMISIISLMVIACGVYIYLLIVLAMANSWGWFTMFLGIIILASLALWGLNKGDEESDTVSYS